MPAVQRWEHFEYVTAWERARHFATVEEAHEIAGSTRHTVYAITEADWRALGGT